MVRPRQALLTRQRIVEVATTIIDSEGLDALSTRRLAAELDVRAPSLYNHFATKEEILDAVGDAIIAEVDISMFGRDPWPDALRALGPRLPRGAGRAPQHRALPRPRAGPAAGRARPRRRGVRRAGRRGLAAQLRHPDRRSDAIPRCRLDRWARSRPASSTTPSSTPSATRTSARRTGCASTSSRWTRAPSSSACETLVDGLERQFKELTRSGRPRCDKATNSLTALARAYKT